MASAFVHPAATVEPLHDDSSAPSDIRDVQSIFLAHYLELVNDQSVMEQLPSGRRLEMKNASSETSRFSITERIIQDYVSGPDPLRSALHAFEGRCRLAVARQPQASSEVRLFDDDMPPVDPRFVGRREPLEKIADALLASEPRSVTIRGVHGIGKSTLARQAVADPRIEDAYDIAWIACDGIATVGDLERALAKAPQLAAHLRNAMQQRPSTSARIIDVGGRTTQGETPPKRLLIVLNRLDKLVAACRRFETPLVSLLRKLEQRRVASLQPRLLITLASDHDLGIDSVNINLEPLAWVEAEDFFVSFEFTRRWREAKNLTSFVQRFDGHPLALAVAARAAPKDGDFETYVAILQRHRHADEDEFDAAIRVLLLDTSLQDPQTRRLLRLVAYWPDECLIDIACAILELPDTRATVHVADAAFKLNIISTRRTTLRTDGGQSYIMLKPFKERLCRIDPLPDEELDAVRRFVFSRVFCDPTWSRWLTPWENCFVRLDPLFLDAFQDSDPKKVIAALDAVLAIPREHYPCFMDSRCRPYFQPVYQHQLMDSTLEVARVAAIRVNDIDRSAALSVSLAETKIPIPNPGANNSLVAEVQAAMQETLITTLAQGSDLPTLRRCCCLLAWCSLMDTRNAADPLQSPYLRQAWHYLSMADLQARSSLPSSLRPGHLRAAQREHATDMIQTGLLRFDACIQWNTPMQAYNEYVTLMAATDQVDESNMPYADTIHLLARFYAATSFAVNGHLAQAAEVLDLAIRALPPMSGLLDDGDTLIPLVILRHYLPGHKDAPYYQQRFGGPDLFNSRLVNFADIDVSSYWCTGIERALVSFETEGQTDVLYGRWIGLLFDWPGFDSDDSRLASMKGYGSNNPHYYRNGMPTNEQCCDLIRHLPPPDHHHPISYHHGYTALVALRDRRFDEAASAFRTLCTIWVSEGALGRIDHIIVAIDAIEEWYDIITYPEADFHGSGLVSAFGSEVMLSGWAAVFGALAKDCISRQAGAPPIAIGTDALNSDVDARSVVGGRSADGSHGHEAEQPDTDESSGDQTELTTGAGGMTRKRKRQSVGVAEERESRRHVSDEGRASE